ncbi:MAG: histidine ammonia-lyase [Armatimonadetes bacterium]|nr:histidine ammonia-lyase [Armatimonadota bacterium]
MLSLSGQSLTLEELEEVAYRGRVVSLDSAARKEMERSLAVVRDIVESNNRIYGVNTGFGRLSDVSVGHDELKALQLNLVRSHACGVGQPLSEPETRAMLLLRANVLAKGLTGARPVVAETLLLMLNRGVLPVVPEKGSVGASGDLAPLAHLALTALGEGEAFYKGVRMPSAEAMKLAGIETIHLEAKEGLAMLNGTQAILALGGLALARGLRAVRSATTAGAMSLEALMGTPAAFDERLHLARPHPGQIAVAAHLRSLLADSEIRESHRENDPRVQDAYSLRCMPQVHGAVLDTLSHAKRVVEIEMGSATDNPIVFPETGEVISGGNFHGAPVAQVMDFAAIALTDLGAISERRIDRLVNPDANEGMPAFLSPSAGVSSGFMIAQVTAAALLAECRVLSHPSSVDSVPTSGGKEDHVSMGTTGAAKLRTVVENVETIIGIEFMCAAQGLEFRKPLRPGKAVESVYQDIRKRVAPLQEDRILSGDIAALAEFVRDLRV